MLHLPKDNANVMMNGTTVHGAQLSDPAERRTPVSYYGLEGPMGDIFGIVAGSSTVDPRRVAVVGLGAGGLATYADSGTEMTFYEIDPIVIEAASDPRLFSFLSDAPRRPGVVLGDARLSLADEPDATYDLLIMDAFTSDSVPIHLLTVEGVAEEIRTLTPDGVIAFNVSSRYYDLSPAIAAALAKLDVVTLRKAGAGRGSLVLPSIWIAASRSPERLDRLRALGWAASLVADRPFTDDYADLLTYLHLGP